MSVSSQWPTGLLFYSYYTDAITDACLGSYARLPVYTILARNSQCTFHHVTNVYFVNVGFYVTYFMMVIIRNLITTDDGIN